MVPSSLPAIQEALTRENVRRCFPVVSQLRPHLNAATFLAWVDRQRPEGYRMVYVDVRGTVRAVAGFRVAHMLHQGRMLYVDDLVTDERSRSRGYGSRLFDWLVSEARRLDCDALELDSGVQRFGAHRFYLGKNMHIASYHFRLPLRSAPPKVLGYPPLKAKVASAARARKP